MHPLNNEQKQDIARQFVEDPKPWAQPSGNVYDYALCDIGDVTIIFAYSYTKPCKPGLGLSVQQDDPEDLLNRLKQLKFDALGFKLNEDQLKKNIEAAKKKNAKTRTLYFYRNGCETPEDAYAQIVSPGQDVTVWRAFFKELVSQVNGIVGVDKAPIYSGDPVSSGNTPTALASSQSAPSDNKGKPLLPRNLIFFGAPGTGKSFMLNEAVNGKRGANGKPVAEGQEGKAIDYERVTFYPTYSYAQFVGCYKPVMEETKSSKKTEILSPEQLTEELKKTLALAEKNAQSGSDSGTKKIVSILLFGEKYSASLGKLTPSDRTKILRAAGATTKADPVYFGHGITMGKINVGRNEETSDSTIAYKFVPGPFLRILVNALNEKPGDDGKKKGWCLVIEEINRANAAAVFGDVFQLLDRKANGESEYEIAASEDVRKFLLDAPEKGGLNDEGKKVLGFKGVEKESLTLKIPSNMYIWATMNSADQGVFPLDTAFKRRWEFKYFGIDDDVTGELEKWTIDGPEDVNGEAYKWNQVRKFINGLLSSHGVNEDKLMGPWFVKPESGTKVSADQFASKVLMYLWEDAGRMCRKEMFGNNILTYSGLVAEWKKSGVGVFSNDTKKDSLGQKLKDWYGKSVKKEEKMTTPEDGAISQ